MPEHDDKNNLIDDFLDMLDVKMMRMMEWKKMLNRLQNNPDQATDAFTETKDVRGDVEYLSNDT